VRDIWKASLRLLARTLFSLLYFLTQLCFGAQRQGFGAAAGEPNFSIFIWFSKKRDAYFQRRTPLSPTASVRQHKNEFIKIAFSANRSEKLFSDIWQNKKDLKT